MGVNLPEKGPGPQRSPAPNPNEAAAAGATPQLKILEFEAPCCWNKRSCSKSVMGILIDYVFGTGAEHIWPENCDKLGHTPKFKFKIPSIMGHKAVVAVVGYYKTSTGKLHLSILWKNSNIEDDIIIESVLEKMIYRGLWR